jgi:hypothetical protein
MDVTLGTGFEVGFELELDPPPPEHPVRLSERRSTQARKKEEMKRMGLPHEK